METLHDRKEWRTEIAFRYVEFLRGTFEAFDQEIVAPESVVNGQRQHLGQRQSSDRHAPLAGNIARIEVTKQHPGRTAEIHHGASDYRISKERHVDLRKRVSQHPQVIFQVELEVVWRALHLPGSAKQAIRHYGQGFELVGTKTQSINVIFQRELACLGKIRTVLPSLLDHHGGARSCDCTHAENGLEPRCQARVALYPGQNLRKRCLPKQRTNPCRYDPNNADMPSFHLAEIAGVGGGAQAMELVA